MVRMECSQDKSTGRLHQAKERHTLFVVVEDCFVKSMFIEVVRREDEDAKKQKQQQPRNRR